MSDGTKALNLPILGDTAPKPEVLQYVQLFNLNKRLQHLLDFFAKTVARGQFVSRLLTVTTQPTRVRHDWLGFTLFNNATSASSVYIMGEQRTPDANTEGGVAPGDSLPVDYKSREIREFWLATASGTAAVRIVAYA